MPRVPVGLRRLFDARGITLSDDHPIRVDFENAEWSVSVYVGPQPRFGVQAVRGQDRYFVPGEPASLGEISCGLTADDVKYPRGVFSEYCVFTSVDVEEPLLNAVAAADAEARGSLLRKIDEVRSDLESVLDAIQGVVGLRIHPQLVLDQIAENEIALTEPEPVRTVTGPALRTLRSVRLTELAHAHLQQLVSGVCDAPTKERRGAGRTLLWLQRGWRTDDHVQRFMSLFVPLERLLSNLDAPVTSEATQAVSELAEMIELHASSDRRAHLLEALDSLSRRSGPTLVQRFEKLAEIANFSTRDSDVSAFRTFNRMRNRLLHQGDTAVSDHIIVGEELVHSLTDLAERYIAFALFSDAGSHRTRFPPSPPTHPVRGRS